MGQFGQQLRQERELRGIALESITGVTKISGRHLLALEDEKFEALPGGVLSKGIVRGYVRAVGLDEEAWMDRYLSAYQQSGKIKDDDVSWMEFAENVGRARKGELGRPVQGMRWAGVALLLTLLALFTWYVAHFVNQRALAEQDLRPPIATLPADIATIAQPALYSTRHQAFPTPQTTAAQPSGHTVAATPLAAAPAPAPAEEPPSAPTPTALSTNVTPDDQSPTQAFDEPVPAESSPH